MNNLTTPTRSAQLAATQPKPLAIIPLDDRMVNYECLALLGQAAGYEVLLPPKDWLGTPWRSGQMDRLIAWLRETAPRAACVIVAVDTLGYGGLVNSRRSTDAVETVLARLQALREIKQENPSLTLLAYNILMRITRSNNPEEEKAYWGTWGARMFRLSVLEDRRAMVASTPDEAAEIAKLRAEIPAELVSDYLTGRARNHTINRAMIEWTAEGVFDYLIIPQDDTVDYGWNIDEARGLRALIRQLRLVDRVSVYPGTDEIDMLLLARYAVRQASFQPRFWTRYSSVRHGQVITSFEDRPMEEVIKAHLGPLEGVLANEAAEADIHLYVNAPAEVQGNGPDQYVLSLDEKHGQGLPVPVQEAIAAYRRSPSIPNTLREMHTPQRNVAEFARSLAQAVAAGKSCAVVDVAYVNSGDRALGDLLCQGVEIAQLADYAGWNTAGNTLGTVLAQSVIRHLQRQLGCSLEALAAHAQFLFLRFVEDYLYMSQIRSQIMLEELPLLGLEPTLGKIGPAEGQVIEIVKARLGQAAAALARDHFVGRRLAGGETAITIDDLTIERLWLPWGRLFDLAVEMHIDYHP